MSFDKDNEESDDFHGPLPTLPNECIETLHCSDPLPKAALESMGEDLYFVDKEIIQGLIKKCIKINKKKAKGKRNEYFHYRLVDCTLDGYYTFVYKTKNNIEGCPCVYLFEKSDLNDVFELIETFFEIGKQATERKYKFNTRDLWLTKANTFCTAIGRFENVDHIFLK